MSGRVRVARRRKRGRIHRAVTSPVTVTFFPLILVAIAALYISWSQAVQFTYLSMGFAAGLVVMATAWMFIRFLFPGDIKIILKDPRGYAIVIAAILVSLSICMLAG
jgi:hypothetical protein